MGSKIRCIRRLGLIFLKGGGRRESRRAKVLGRSCIGVITMEGGLRRCRRRVFRDGGRGLSLGTIRMRIRLRMRCEGEGDIFFYCCY